MSAHMFRFVVIEKDCFVARDMQDGLQSAAPDCDVLRLARPEDAEDAFAQVSRADPTRIVIITKLTVAQLDSSGMARLAHDFGADIVVRLGDDPVQKVIERGWYSLASPFTWDDLAELVGGLTRRPAVA